MRDAYAVALFEFKEKQRLLLVALLLSILPFIVGMYPAGGYDRGVVTGLTAMVLAVGMAAAAALAFGTSTARELVERRLSFYLTRPLSASTVWLGKTAAALLASMLCFLVIAFPGWLASSSGWRNEWPWQLLSGIAFGTALLLYLVSHSVATITRSRSSLLALDLLFSVLVFLALRGIVRRLSAGEALQEIGAVFAGSLFVLLIALMTAPIWQIAQGRNDIRASHRELSRVFWLTIGVGLVVGAAYVAWLIPTEIDELRVESIAQSPAGGEFVVSGTRVAGGTYADSFLASQRTDNHLRLGTPARTLAWSAHGEVVAWTRLTTLLPDPLGSEIYIRRDGDEPRSTGIRTPYSATFVLSDDGSRLAVLADGNLSVHDLTRSTLLGSASTQAADFTPMTFVDSDHVRLYRQESSTPNVPHTIEIWELNVPSRSFRRTGELAVPFQTYLSLSPDKSRILARGSGLIADARSGQELGRVSGVSRAPFASTILSGNVVGVIDNDAEPSLLTFYSETGARLGNVQLQGVEVATITGETADGKLIVAGRNPANRSERNGMFVVDRATMQIDHFVPGVLGPIQHDPHTLTVPMFSESSTFAAMDHERRLFVWDPATGASRLFGGRD